ncbi:MAG: von Willebrand factor type A domain-containing protein [Pseudotabrizicola sp.]|uniref:YfbK domain-containing protein n=1 Tax=Pseudotabrizicola sp. TaxID=2939647 RepID=UPI00271FE936|nr:von Willebrand factor type A domain-containing protein [Pseudotabrizicola sp.]MDO9640251.1 von Willebrand factor type A domain-containing protein [Pseudotabrizicola sp.]
MTRDPEFDKLRAALQAAPASDPAARAEALNRAMAAYEDSALSRQGSATPLRSTADRPPTAGFASGVRKMLRALTLKPILAATTSAAALAVGLVVFLPQAEVPTSRMAAPDPAQRSEEMAAMAPAEVAEPAPEPMMTRKTTPAPAAPQGGAADLVLEVAPSVMSVPEPGLMVPDVDTEVFANAGASPVQVTAETPVSTFSAEVDTASYAIIRSSLMAGSLPPPDAVRVEEMLNYFPYTYPAPEAGEPPFRPSITVMPTPWNPDTRLVQIGLQGRMPEVAARPPLNLVLLIDTSGSMNEPGKLPLLKQSLGLMLAELRPEDQVAIVAYAGSVGEVLAPTPAGERATILAALDRLDAGGATAGAAGLTLAYRLAEGMTAAGEVSRILLATDGDFNLGVDDPEGLEAFVARKRKTGVYLSVLGFGRGNLDDAVMQSLAQNGNGTAAYIDTLLEARKVLVDQLTGVLFPIADDVKVQVEWNPEQVAEYRLIGYETRALRREDFNIDAVDAGEIGAGHQVTAIYEVTAPGSPALRHDPLRYGAPVADAMADEAATGDIVEGAPELGFLRLRYKAPGESVSALIEAPIVAGGEVGDGARFASAVAGFGQLLRGSVYLGDWGWDEAITLAEASRGEDRFGYRNEAVTLMRLAQSLAQ